nr:chromate efflux transporter [Conexibacter arvalis]
MRTIVREWGRIGCLGFGGPPAHVSMLRELCVARRRWIDEEEFEHAIAATNVLPGPASTQLAVYCAWRLRGVAGALAGGAAFILPGLIVIVALAILFLGDPPAWVRGAGAGAGAVVAAVALDAALRLLPGSWRRARGRGRRGRWVAWVLAGAVATATLGPWLVLVLLACGLIELAWHRAAPDRPGGGAGGGGASGGTAGAGGGPTARLVAWPAPAAVLAAVVAGGGLAALCWTAFKVGALSYGGGFVIVPLMQADAVDRFHWMSDAEFLNAVALGQATPGPVTQTIAVVGYAAHGLGGAAIASLVAFAPSFAFIALGADRFDRLSALPSARAFLAGAGPASIGAIAGSAIPLAAGLTEPWQAVVLAAGALLLLVARRGVVLTLLLAAAAGIAVALLGGPVG